MIRAYACDGHTAVHCFPTIGWGREGGEGLQVFQGESIGLEIEGIEKNYRQDV